MAKEWESRFWSKVDKNGPVPESRRDLGPCWIWLAKKDQGYGRFSVNHSRQLRSCRIAYELLRGPIEPKLTLDHLCRNRACVNPSHLEAVTNKINLMRGESPSARNAMKTHCFLGHPLNDDLLKDLDAYISYLRNRIYPQDAGLVADDLQEIRKNLAIALASPESLGALEVYVAEKVRQASIDAYLAAHNLGDCMCVKNQANFPKLPPNYCYVMTLIVELERASLSAKEQGK